MAEEKDKEIERLRRLLAPYTEEKPSRMKRIVTRLGNPED
jgi:hypothetical protein